jgi:hypothetical protein
VRSIPYMAQKKQGVCPADFDKKKDMLAALSNRRRPILGACHVWCPLLAPALRSAPQRLKYILATYP